MKLSSPQLAAASPWPHRVALLLLCVTFPLIWVGGLVTTYDAGMAVPDWPGTYGYNLLLYPWQSWLAGPWDLFIEHGHRLLGALAGIVTIVLVAVAWRWESRQWVRWLILGALGAVIFQGLLGGARVLLDQRQLALIHGCVGPGFFALVASVCVVTSRVWRSAERLEASSPLREVAGLTLLLAYAQLILGAHLRHAPPEQSPQVFRWIVLAHLFVAAALVVQSLAAVWISWSRHGRHLRRPATALGLLSLCQVLLGGASWVVKYGWPGWLEGLPMASAYTVQQQSMVQSLVVTGHVATGSLIIAVAMVLTLRTTRLMAVPAGVGKSGLPVNHSGDAERGSRTPCTAGGLT